MVNRSVMGIVMMGSSLTNVPGYVWGVVEWEILVVYVVFLGGGVASGM